MVTVDIRRLRGKMAENSYGISSFSDALGISRATLTSYLKEPSKMPYSIISKMASLLCDNIEEARNIFFASDLRNTKV